MNTNKKRTTVVLLVVAMTAVLVFGSFAYFTDRETAQVTGTAGTVDIKMTNTVQLADADGKNILNPGDMRTSSFKVDNVGNKSVDIRENIVLTSSVKMTEERGQAEFEIYNSADVTNITGYGYVPYAFTANATYTDATVAYKAFVAGGYLTPETFGLKAAPAVGVRTFDASGLKVSYFIDGIVLDGKSVKGDYTDAELDTTATAANAVTTTDGLYVLVFRGTANNNFQNATLTMDILAEAKQHRNTDGKDWTNVSQEAFTFGGNAVQAVPAAVAAP
ncbi:MAG: TasA family protein [Oscillospiraceae bacterium]